MARGNWARAKASKRAQPRRAPPPPTGLLGRLKAWWARLLRRAPAEGPQETFVSRAGFPLASHGEVIIANWLDARGYVWEYEARVGGFTPDFMLRKERVLVEYWGMIGRNRKYDSKIALKKRRYREHGWKVLTVEPRHLGRLDERLGRVLVRPKTPDPHDMRI